MCCDRAAAVSDRAAARRGSERRPQNRREACYPCQNVHGLLLSVADPCPASTARVFGDGVDERRIPPTVGCRTRETEWGERRRSSAQGDSLGESTPGELLRGERLSYDFMAVQRMGGRRSLPRVRSVRGRAARREAASLRLSRRPAHGERRSSAQGEQRQ